MIPDYLQDLIDAHFSGAIDATERAELDSLLLNNSEARQAFLVSARLHVQLTLALNRDTVVADDSPLVEAASKRRPAASTAGSAGGMASWAKEFIGQPLSLVLLASALVCGAVLAWKLSQTPSHPVAGNIETPAIRNTHAAVARLTRSVGAKWRSPDKGAIGSSTSLMRDGTELAEGQRLLLEQGLAEIMLNSGVTMVVEGPAEFFVRSQKDVHDKQTAAQSPANVNSVILAAGKLVARVPSPARGFAVHTPVGRIVDLGTEFGLVVTPNPPEKKTAEQPEPKPPSVQVHVFEGRVALEAANPDSTKDPLELTVGQVAMLEAGGKPRVIAQADAVAFVRAIPVSQQPVASIRWPRDGTLHSGDIVVATTDDLKLVRIDPQTGGQSLLATGKRKLHGNWTSLAVDGRGNVIVGADNLPGVGLGVLRIDPRDGSIAALGGAATSITPGAQSISSVTARADGKIYATFHGPTTDQIVEIDPRGGIVSPVAAFDDACAIQADHSGDGLLIVGARKSMIGQFQAGELTRWVENRQAVGSPGSVTVRPGGRVFVGSTFGEARKVLAIESDAPHVVKLLATLPSSERPGGRWNLVAEAKGTLIAGPSPGDSRVFRINAATGEVTVVSAGGLLGGDSVVAIVP